MAIALMLCAAYICGATVHTLWANRRSGRFWRAFWVHLPLLAYVAFTAPLLWQ